MKCQILFVFGEICVAPAHSTCHKAAKGHLKEQITYIWRVKDGRNTYWYACTLLDPLHFGLFTTYMCHLALVLTDTGTTRKDCTGPILTSGIPRVRNRRDVITESQYG